MNKNKLLRVAMLLSLLAPTAESMTVLAQDVMLETHKATTNETSDSSSKEENNKNAAPTTSDKTDKVPLMLLQKQTLIVLLTRMIKKEAILVSLL